MTGYHNTNIRKYKLQAIDSGTNTRRLKIILPNKIHKIKLYCLQLNEFPYKRFSDILLKAEMKAETVKTNISLENDTNHRTFFDRPIIITNT